MRATRASAGSDGAPTRPLPAGRLIGEQVVLVLCAIAAYFGVRGLTEGSADTAQRNADWVRDLERWAGVAWEQPVQDAAAWWQPIATLGNWIYIWGHWPVVAGTLIWLLWAHREDFVELRNAMFVSGAIGLVIYMSFPVAPPRLFSPEYVDTVTLQSEAYRVFQPPGFVNKYAAVPSLHFGWNLLVGLAWARVGGRRVTTVAGVLMPIGMAWAVVVTANHWVFDVVAGGVVAMTGWLTAHAWRRRRARSRGTTHEPWLPDEPVEPAGPTGTNVAAGLGGGMRDERRWDPEHSPGREPMAAGPRERRQW